MESIKDLSNVKEYLDKAEELYEHTKSLDRESINDFCRAMSIVCIRETEESTPRNYMLQSMSKVAIINMDREKYVWNEIWTAISPNIVYGGSHKNKSIAEFFIKLLTDLSEKLLAKEEKTDYHYQERFLSLMLDIYYGASHRHIQTQAFYPNILRK